MARPRDPRKANVLEGWLSSVKRAFEGRILPIDEDVVDEWGRMNAPDPRPIIDCLMAATAKVNGLTLVTRNVSHLSGTGVSVLNPFDPH